MKVCFRQKFVPVTGSSRLGCCLVIAHEQLINDLNTTALAYPVTKTETELRCRGSLLRQAQPFCAAR